MASSWLATFNLFLPFATPGTPLLQDCLHLAAICLLLYFAPQIQESFQKRRESSTGDDDTATEVQQEEHHAERPDLQQDIPAPAQQEPAPLPNNDNDDQPGPANPRPIPPAAGAGGGPNIGAKKAKSLARRDQRRAHNEFLRAQGDAQRAADSAGAAEREAQLAREQARRAEVAASLQVRQAAEREARREKERREWEEGVARREEVGRVVRSAVRGKKGMCSLFEVADEIAEGDEEWVEGVVKASTGILGRSRSEGEDGMTVLTGMGWVVNVPKRDVMGVYEEMARAEKYGEGGVVSYEQLGVELEKRLRARAGQKVS